MCPTCQMYGQPFTNLGYRKSNRRLALISVLSLFPRLMRPCGLISCLHRNVNLFCITEKGLLLPSATNNNCWIVCVCVWGMLAPVQTTAVLWLYLASQRQRDGAGNEAKMSSLECSNPLCWSSASIIYCLWCHLQSLSAFNSLSLSVWELKGKAMQD